ncbi:unnamed protein product, partial [Larinioides sclopetarius]
VSFVFGVGLVSVSVWFSSSFSEFEFSGILYLKAFKSLRAQKIESQSSLASQEILRCNKLATTIKSDRLKDSLTAFL